MAGPEFRGPREETMKKLFIICMFACWALPAAAATISVRIAFQLNGPLTELQAQVKQGNAIQNKINPGVGRELWANVIHGPNVNSASLVTYYEDMAQYAQAIANQQASSEWGEFIANFPIDRFPITYNGMSQTLVGGDSDLARGGEALVIFGFNTTAGPAGLAERVQQAVEIQSRVNPKATISMSVPTIAGDNVNGAAVFTRYPSLADWAEGGEKLAASSEWAEFIAAFPADQYSIGYQGLSEAVSLE